MFYSGGERVQCALWFDQLRSVCVGGIWLCIWMWMWKWMWLCLGTLPLMIMAAGSSSPGPIDGLHSHAPRTAVAKRWRNKWVSSVDWAWMNVIVGGRKCQVRRIRYSDFGCIKVFRIYVCFILRCLFLLDNKSLCFIFGCTKALLTNISKAECIRKVPADMTIYYSEFYHSSLNIPQMHLFSCQLQLQFTPPSR